MLRFIAATKKYQVSVLHCPVVWSCYGLQMPTAGRVLRRALKNSCFLPSKDVDRLYSKQMVLNFLQGRNCTLKYITLNCYHITQSILSVHEVIMKLYHFLRKALYTSDLHGKHCTKNVCLSTESQSKRAFCRSRCYE